jgi:hypothetical protein
MGIIRYGKVISLAFENFPLFHIRLSGVSDWNGQYIPMELVVAGRVLVESYIGT